jgi:hypothetical protein
MSQVTPPNTPNNSRRQRNELRAAAGLLVGREYRRRGHIGTGVGGADYCRIVVNTRS